MRLESGLQEGRTHEARQVHGRADHRGVAGARGRSEDGRSVPQARHVGSAAVQLESQIRGMDVSEAKRPRALEEENRKLKKLLAEAMLDQAALKELLSKKW